MILLRIKERLELGAKKYGDTIDLNDSRDFLKEAIEEALDMTVYLTTFLFKIESALRNRPQNEINVDELILIMDGLGKLILAEKETMTLPGNTKSTAVNGSFNRVCGYSF